MSFDVFPWCPRGGMTPQLASLSGKAVFCKFGEKPLRKRSLLSLSITAHSWALVSPLWHIYIFILLLPLTYLHDNGRINMSQILLPSANNPRITLHATFRWPVNPPKRCHLFILTVAFSGGSQQQQKHSSRARYIFFYISVMRTLTETFDGKFEPVCFSRLRNTSVM